MTDSDLFRKGQDEEEDENDAAYIDSFFLPGGILDPDVVDDVLLDDERLLINPTWTLKHSQNQVVLNIQPGYIDTSPPPAMSTTTRAKGGTSNGPTPTDRIISYAEIAAKARQQQDRRTKSVSPVSSSNVTTKTIQTDMLPQHAIKIAPTHLAQQQQRSDDTGLLSSTSSSSSSSSLGSSANKRHHHRQRRCKSLKRPDLWPEEFNDNVEQIRLSPQLVTTTTVMTPVQTTTTTTPPKHQKLDKKKEQVSSAGTITKTALQAARVDNDNHTENSHVLDMILHIPTRWISWMTSSTRATAEMLARVYQLVLLPLSQCLGTLVSFPAKLLILAALAIANISKYALAEMQEKDGAILSYLLFYAFPNLCTCLTTYTTVPHYTSHVLSYAALSIVCRTTPQSLPKTDRLTYDLCRNVLQTIHYAIPFSLIVWDGCASQANTHWMLLNGTSRLLLAYTLSLIRCHLLLSPVAWLFWSCHVLLILSYYTSTWPGVLMEGVLLWMGLASVRLSRKVQAATMVRVKE